jgi:hypothetical protein
MSYLCFEDRVASWSVLGLVEEGNNVLTIYRHPPRFWASSIKQRMDRVGPFETVRRRKPKAKKTEAKKTEAPLTNRGWGTVRETGAQSSINSFHALHLCNVCF